MKYFYFILDLTWSLPLDNLIENTLMIRLFTRHKRIVDSKTIKVHLFT